MKWLIACFAFCALRLEADSPPVNPGCTKEQPFVHPDDALPIPASIPHDSFLLDSVWIHYLTKPVPDSDLVNISRWQAGDPFYKFHAYSGSFEYLDRSEQQWFWIGRLHRLDFFGTVIIEMDGNQYIEFTRLYRSSGSQKSSSRHVFLLLSNGRLTPVPDDSVCGHPLTSYQGNLARHGPINPFLALEVDCSRHGVSASIEGKLYFYPFKGKSIRLDPILFGKQRDVDPDRNFSHEYAQWSDDSCTYLMNERRELVTLCDKRARKMGVMSRFPAETHFRPYWGGYPMRLCDGSIRFGRKCFSNLINIDARQYKSILDSSPPFHNPNYPASKLRVYCATPTSLDSFEIIGDRHRQLGPSPEAHLACGEIDSTFRQIPSPIKTLPDTP